MDWYIYRYFLNFSLWLFVEEGFFALPLPRRKGFWLRLAGLMTAYFIAGYGTIELVTKIPAQYSFLASNAYYMGIFGVSLCILKCCFAVEWKETLFVGTAGYAVQHITYALDCVLQRLGQMYGWSMGFLEPLDGLHLYLLTGAVSYWLLVRKHQKLGELKKVDIRMSLISLGILCSSVALSEAIGAWGGSLSPQHQIVCRLYAVLTCLMGLMLQFDLSKRNRAETDREILEQLLSLEQQKQVLTRESIDLINMKCHDLKYQIAALGQMDSSEQRRESIAQLQKSVMIYDDMIRTGNETLDLVLTEKSLLCRKYNISLSCMVDGKWLDFLSTADLYSLFGNALDNAIEAVSSAEESHRVITLRAARQQKMLLIHMDNYCPAEPTFSDGLPVTTKEDEQYHGFGTRSIRYIVHRYGGELNMGWKDDRFDLDILFALPES